MHGAAPKIPENIQKKIVALVMYGDPGRKRNQKFPGELQARLFENCAKGDALCGDDGTQGDGHTSYRTGTFHKDGAGFIAAAFQGKPLPGRP
jgi:cutinase